MTKIDLSWLVCYIQQQSIHYLHHTVKCRLCVTLRKYSFCCYMLSCTSANMSWRHMLKKGFWPFDLWAQGLHLHLGDLSFPVKLFKRSLLVEGSADITYVSPIQYEWKKDSDLICLTEIMPEAEILCSSIATDNERKELETDTDSPCGLEKE